MRRTVDLLTMAFVGLISLAEIPFFLLRNMRIFRNEMVCVIWHWSFGHTVVALDFTARLYFPHKISVVYLLSRGSNSFLTGCFENLDSFLFSGFFLSDSIEAGKVRFKAMNFALAIVCAFLPKVYLIYAANVYKTVSLAKDKLRYGNEATDKIEKYSDFTGYVRLLRAKIGAKPSLPAPLKRECEGAIRRRFPSFFDRPFVTLLLREKGDGGPISTKFRCSGPQENYRPLVEYFTNHGYHVAGTGETLHSVFSGVKGYFSPADIGVDAKLLNLYLLSNCALFVGQQSGPSALANTCGIPCLITDAFPYRIGTFNEEDLILFKRFRDRSTGRVLSLAEVFRFHRDLAMGCCFEKKNIEVIDNSPEELLEAAEEMAAKLQCRLVYSEEDNILIEKFRSLPADDMGLFYHRNRTILPVLRRLKSELLEGQSKS